MRPSGRRIAAVPTPPFMARAMPKALPTVAPAPAPMLPSATGAVVAAAAARYPHSASGRMRGSPISRSKRIAAGTIGTRTLRTSNPRPCSSSQRCTPVAASRPKALPPASTIALTRSTVFTGFSRSVSRVPGAEPRTSTLATAAGSTRTTVHPVGRALSVKCPTSRPPTAVSVLLVWPDRGWATALARRAAVASNSCRQPDAPTHRAPALAPHARASRTSPQFTSCPPSGCGGPRKGTGDA